MPSDIEMGDSDSSILDTEITLDPEIIANIKPAPERVVHRYKSIFAIQTFGDLAGGAGI
jgi:hypothetical protein